MGVLAGGVQEGIRSLKALSQESGHGPGISRRAGEVQSLGASTSTEGAGLGWRDRQGSTDCPTYYYRIRASRPASSSSRKKLPECLGLIILFSSPVLAKGAKESRQQPGEEPPSRCSTPATPRGPEAGAEGGEAGSQSTSQAPAGTAQFFPGSWKGRGLLAPQAPGGT